MLNAAIVGLGRWGQVLAASVPADSDRIRFVRAVTRTPSNAAGFARRSGIPVDADFDGMLRDPAIDAVVLATPHSLHVSQIEAAARAGKHVFVEKPLALTVGDVDHAYDACQRAGVVLAVGQNRRFLPAIARIRELLAARALGTVLHVEGNFSGPSGYRHERSRWRADRRESPAGGMTGKGLHLTDLMIWLLGPIAEVNAVSLRRVLDGPLDDTTSMLLRFRSGGTGYLATMTATADIIRLQIFGSEGWVEMRDHTRLTVKFLREPEKVTRFDDVDIQRLELEAFADAALGKAEFPVRRDEVANNIALLEGVQRSAEEGRPVSL